MTQEEKSENNKIKEDLIQWINDFPDTIWRGHYKKDIISWLEKQSEQKSIDYDEELKKCQENPLYFIDKYVKFEKKQPTWTKEDEKIRNWLIGYFHQYKEDGMEKYANGLKVESIISWLEKQSNNKNWKPSKGQINALEHFVRSIGESGYASPYDNYTKLLKSLIDDLYKLEKQEERKFNEGDVVVSNQDGKVYIVGATYYTTGNDDIYLYGTDGNHKWTNKDDLDRNYHLWSIEDAKNGDVLVTIDDKQPFIYKGCLDPEHPNSPVAYCGIDSEKYFSSNSDEFNHWWTDEKVQPATKEQRDLLFAKMKEAGYEWDADKKELKKIANALEECEIVHVEHGKYYYCIKDYYAGGNKRASKGDVVQALNGMSMMALGVKANEYFAPVNTIKQMSAWSEEDEKILDDIIEEVRPFGECPDYPTDEEREYYYGHAKMIDWLKSLKQRIEG